MPDACIELKVPKALRDEVAQVFALTDGFSAEHLDDEYAELCRRLEAKLIRTALGLHQLDPEFCRRELLLRHPMAWLIEIDGLVIDARALPAHIQAEARRRGLIPDVPVPARA